MSCDLCIQGRHYVPPSSQTKKEAQKSPRSLGGEWQGGDLHSGSLILDLTGLTMALLKPYGPTSIPMRFLQICQWVEGRVGCGEDRAFVVCFSPALSPKSSSWETQILIYFSEKFSTENRWQGLRKGLYWAIHT